MSGAPLLGPGVLEPQSGDVLGGYRVLGNLGPSGGNSSPDTIDLAPAEQVDLDVSSDEFDGAKPVALYFRVIPEIEHSIGHCNVPLVAAHHRAQPKNHAVSDCCNANRGNFWTQAGYRGQSPFVELTPNIYRTAATFAPSAATTGGPARPAPYYRPFGAGRESPNVGAVCEGGT